MMRETSVMESVEAKETRGFRILVQHCRNQLWFRRMDVWTEAATEACDFGHSQKALDFIARHGLRDVQLVIKFGEAGSDVTVRLPGTETEPQLTCV